PHFRYHARAGDPLCASLLDRLEANLGTVARMLGLDPAKVSVDYYKYRDDDDSRTNGPCPNDWDACTGGTAIHTGVQAFQHELIHAYVAHLGQPNNVFQEGLAELFNCDGLAGPSPPGVSWQEVAMVAHQPPSAESGPISRTAYYAAATFLVRRLIDRF